jgi:hypothetical protein
MSKGNGGNGNGHVLRKKVLLELKSIGMPSAWAEEISKNEIEEFSAMVKEPCLQVSIKLKDGNSILINRATYFRVDPKTKKKVKRYQLKLYDPANMFLNLPPCSLDQPLSG